MITNAAGSIRNASGMAFNGSGRKPYVWYTNNSRIKVPLPGIGFDSPQCATIFDSYYRDE